jgi:hypothetical protein
METKFAIGCLVQWYEVEIIEEYVETLKEATNQYKGQVIVDFTIVTNQTLEKCVSKEQLSKCIKKIKTICDFGNVRCIDELYTIADYRREFNANYCNLVDVLMWGESDSLIPKQTFIILNSLHQNIQTPKYLGFFGGCKMWDDSWKELEHPDFTDKPFIEGDDKNWWSLRYTMNKNEMNSINEKTEELDVRALPRHKFNGCGLVISSEVVKSGVNIPKSVFFVHEDTAFMHMTNRVLGNIPQYVIKNILLVHNRKHPKKRMYVKGEDKNLGMQARRETNDWYMNAHQMSESNCYNLFNPNYKSFTWENVYDPEYKNYAFSEAVKQQLKNK